jgi:uncharacterized membrane protein
MHQQWGNLPFLHPMLIVFPLGLLTVAAIFDIIYISTHNGHLADL